MPLPYPLESVDLPGGSRLIVIPAIRALFGLTNWQHELQCCDEWIPYPTYGILTTCPKCGTIFRLANLGADQ
jgi:hypothetical protein